MKSSRIGWLDRRGILYQCGYMEHWSRAKSLCRKLYQRELDMAETQVNCC